MPERDPIARIRAAEQDAATRVATARAQATVRRQTAEVDAEQLLAQTRRNAEKEAEFHQKAILAEADAEVALLQRQSREAIEALRHRLAQHLDEAVDRIVCYVLP